MTELTPLQNCMYELIVNNKNNLIKEYENVALTKMYVDELFLNYKHLEETINEVLLLADCPNNEALSETDKVNLKILFNIDLNQITADKEVIFNTFGLFPKPERDINKQKETESITKLNITVENDVYSFNLNSNHYIIDVKNTFEKLANFPHQTLSIDTIDQCISTKEYINSFLSDHFSNNYYIVELMRQIAIVEHDSISAKVNCYAEMLTTPSDSSLCFQELLGQCKALLESQTEQQ